MTAGSPMWSDASGAAVPTTSTGVRLTVYSGDVADFKATPLQRLVDDVAKGVLPITVGRVFHIDDIVQAHRVMEENSARGKIVVLAR